MQIFGVIATLKAHIVNNEHCLDTSKCWQAYSAQQDRSRLFWFFATAQDTQTERVPA
jgi:hypothetical protein